MLLKEGGVGGHMSHLYDNPRLTFADIKKVLQAASAGQLEGTEKTDGQNLFISFSVPEQKAKGARNKSNIKDGGLDAADLAKKFAGRGPLEKTFAEALAAFEQVVQEMPRAQQIQIFGPNTNVYFSAEIIDPRSTNLINYDTKTLAIHRGGAEFSRETGDPIEIEVEDPNYPGELMKTTKDVSTNAELLDSLLKDKQEDIKKRDYGVEMDAIKVLKGLEEDTALDFALDELEKEISSEGISDNQTVLEYVMAKISNWFQEEGMGLDPEVEKKVLQKILLTDPGYRYAYGYGRKLDKEWNKGAILKDVPPENKEDVRRAIDNAGSILKSAIAPIESIIHDFSVEMLKSLKSIFILDNEKELARQRKEVETAIKAIEASGSEEAMTILQKQMEKLKRVENISTAAEGFVFDYDGHTYKFTGNFAPMNQLLGLFKYGRKGIPAMEKLDESFINEVLDTFLEQLGQEKKIILYPGRFQPMGKHHLEVFRKLEEEHGAGNVYIITSNNVKLPKSPLNFEEKKQIMLRHGIPEEQILQATSPYRASELDKYFDPSDTIAIYAVGKKDMDSDPRFANLDGVTKSGSPGWYKSYEENKDDLEVIDKHGYVTVAPHVCIMLKTGEEMCGTSIRSSMENLDEESFEDLMGWFDQDLYDMLKEKTSGAPESLQEAIFSLIEEVMQEKEDKVSKEISKLSSKDECEDNHDQCVVIALSKEERGELEEISSGAGSVAGSPGRFNSGEVGSEKMCDAGYSMHADGKC
nr:hypothetical protein [Nitrospinota bacterium]